VEQIRKRYRYSIILLKQLVKTDFKLRYQGSVLGYIWSLLRPLFLFVILYFVFTVFLPVGKGVPHYPVYLFTGLIIWNYFSEVTTGSVGAIVERGELIRKINFPKYVIILAKSFSALINLLLNCVVLAVFMLIGHIALTRHALVLLPLVVELFVIALAAAFFLSALFVKFRDVVYIWEVIMQAGFYGTPILYPLSKIVTAHHKIASVMVLNPLAQIIQDARKGLVTDQSATISTIYHSWVVWLVPIGITVVIAFVGSTYFRSRSKYFAEEV
jgi:ABC-2 type transport system permease protein